MTQTKMVCPKCGDSLPKCECGVGASILDAAYDPQLYNNLPYPKMELGPSGQYHYSLRRTRKSSDQLGPCHVCGEWCSDVYSQNERRPYTRIDGAPGMTLRNCATLLGHESCLRQARQ